MPAIENSKPSPISETVPSAHTRSWVPVACVAVLASLLSAAAVWFVWRQGWTLYYGDAEAHLNIARRVIDSRTPGYEQLGTSWLPLLHILLLPFVARDALWHNGLAGAIPPAICFIAGVTFLFAAVRRVFSNTAAGAVAAALYALNPNALYLQSIPMTETLFFAALAGGLYFSVRFRETQSLGSVVGAGIAVSLGALARYDAWFLIPFVTAYFLFTGRRRFRAAFVFGAIASVGPLLWLAFNAWVFDNALEFYNGAASAKAIQHGLPYPGKGDWQLALLYYGWAARACAGAPLFFVGAVGIFAALWKRAFWPFVLLTLPVAFYVLNLHSGDTPIHLFNLPPHGIYNTRYGLAALPLLAFCGATLVALVRKSRMGQLILALGVLGICIAPWLVNRQPDTWITWKESQYNSVARRAWTRQAADYLAHRYHRGDGVFTSFGDMTGIFRLAGIPLRDTLTNDNGPAFDEARLRPDLLLWEQWAVVTGGDPMQTAINHARRRGPNYDLMQRIIVKWAPVVEIYERHTAPIDWLHPIHEDSIPESARREE
jgi:hypothetical protein